MTGLMTGGGIGWRGHGRVEVDQRTVTANVTNRIILQAVAEQNS